MTNDSAPSYIHTGGAAGLGPHSDKTLDMAPGSVFVSVNVGATRAMLLRRRDGGHEQRVLLRHGAAIVIGPRTNAAYTHGIPPARGGGRGAEVSGAAGEPVIEKAPRAAACLVHDLRLQKVTSPRFTILNNAMEPCRHHNPYLSLWELYYGRYGL